MQPGPSTHSSSLQDLQAYVATMEQERGFATSTIVEQTMKLTEETGEVAKAVRKRGALPVGPASTTGSLSDELADVLVYVAARVGIDLCEALRGKEDPNETRTWP